MRPVNHPDRRSGAECRFRRRVYGNRFPEQPAIALNDGSIEALAEGTAMWSDTKTTVGLILFAGHTDDRELDGVGVGMPVLKHHGVKQ